MRVAADGRKHPHGRVSGGLQRPLPVTQSALLADPLPSLVSLQFTHNQIGDLGLVALAGGLAQPNVLPALRTLLLGGNRIGDEGAVALADCFATVTNPRSDLA